jgi:hypothetical protein
MVFQTEDVEPKPCINETVSDCAYNDIHGSKNKNIRALRNFILTSI